MRRLVQIAITSTLLALTLQPGSARAGTVGGQVHSHLEHLVYVANVGETNDVTITGSGTTYSIHDSAGVTAGMDCTQVDATNATCESSRASFHDISVATRDGDDIVHISSDTLTHVFGGRGNDQLFAGSENPDIGVGNVLSGGPGADTMGGEPGVRTMVFYDSRSTPVRVSLDGVANDGERGEGDNVLPSIYSVGGSPAGDHFVGSSADDGLFGVDGNDTLLGLGGSDRLNGWEGNDLIIGGQGSDQLVGGPQNDTVKGRRGDDELHGKTGADSLSGGGGNDTLESVDQWVDDVTCGAGTDSATVDRHDVVARNCENVTIEKPHGRA